MTTPNEPSEHDPKASLSAEQREVLGRLEHLSYVLDDLFEIPVVHYRIGLDAIAGLIPVIGDVLGAIPSLYIVHQAWKLNLSKSVIGRMVVNLVLEVIVGSVPVFGDIFDAVWKANDRNLYLIKRHLGTIHEDEAPSNEGLYIFLATAFVMATALVMLVVQAFSWLVSRVF